ncbi:MAG TPA: hypothetical protein VM077_05805 [Candidatus Limnocylindrales bacterium]|nr:hypothetical protein [Candidatus Limnocylindrales bacterium]
MSSERRLGGWRGVAAGTLMLVGGATVADNIPGVNVWDRLKGKVGQKIEQVVPHVEPNITEKILEVLPGKLRDLGNVELAERPYTVIVSKTESPKVDLPGKKFDFVISARAIGEKVTKTNLGTTKTIMPLGELPDDSIIISKENRTITLLLSAPILADVRLDNALDIDGKPKTNRDPGVFNTQVGINKPLVETDELDLMTEEELIRRGWADTELFDRSKIVGDQKISGFTRSVVVKLLGELGVPEATLWKVTSVVPSPKVPDQVPGPGKKDIKLNVMPGEVKNL